MWTPAKVKAELPDVSIQVGRKVCRGRVTGRLNPVATVTVTEHRCGYGYPPWHDWHFSWEAIARSLNDDKPLSV